MIRVSLRDLQWRRRRFVIVVFVAALAFGLALVMTGVTNQLSQEGTNTVALFDADQWVVAEGVQRSVHHLAADRPGPQRRDRCRSPASAPPARS